MGHKYPTNEATLVGSFLYSFTGRIEALPPEIFKETIEVPFEGINARIPKDYDTYLKCLYGDYMKLPPEEKRIGHHYSKALSYDIGWEDYIYKGKR
jgi:lipopolysaccharide cholinephosphotransferase